MRRKNSLVVVGMYECHPKLGGNPRQPISGARLNRFSCSLPGLTGFTEDPPRRNRRGSPMKRAILLHIRESGKSFLRFWVIYFIFHFTTPPFFVFTFNTIAPYKYDSAVQMFKLIRFSRTSMCKSFKYPLKKASCARVPRDSLLAV